jgi:hypothetical protein
MAVATNTSSVARGATRTAEIIHAVKITLLVVNGLAGLALIIVGFASASSTGTDEYGLPTSSVNPISVGLGLYGVGLLVIGTLVILVMLGWFEDMLRTNAELVRLAWLRSPEAVLVDQH